ncbi:hypothetical protein KKH23_10560 [Patescibacteria group bacterium]|nr:hypothetical protein [Patescibacteria group bacterium]
MEGWLGRVIVLWLMIGLIGALLSGQVAFAEDTESVNAASQFNIQSGTSSVFGTITHSISMLVDALLFVAKMLTWDSPLFAGSMQIVRYAFWAVGISIVMGLTIRVFGR